MDGISNWRESVVIQGVQVEETLSEVEELEWLFKSQGRRFFFLKSKWLNALTVINSSDKLRSESCPLVNVLGWNVFAPNWYVEVKLLEPQNLTDFGDRVFWKVTKIKWGHMGGALTQYNWYPSKKRRLGADTEGRWPSTRQGERPEKQPSLLPASRSVRTWIAAV